MIAGKDAAVPGEAKNSWLTGTAAWNWLAITQYILGIKPCYDGLVVDPCISPDWKSYTVRRKFRDAVYEIAVENPDGVSRGVRSMSMDGAPVEGNKLPFISGEHKVTVVLG